MKKFKFEERIPTVIVQYYEVVAETEEEALAMVQDGQGFIEAFTGQETFHDAKGLGEIELYDTEEILESIICPGCSQTWCECE